MQNCSFFVDIQSITISSRSLSLNQLKQRRVDAIRREMRNIE